jgi:hypothetical protein
MCDIMTNMSQEVSQPFIFRHFREISRFLSKERFFYYKEVNIMRKLGFTALALGAALTLSLGLGAPQASVVHVSADTELENSQDDGGEDQDPSPSGTDASAYSIDATNTKNDVLAIKPASNTKEILVGTASLKKVKNSSDKTISVTTWDTYEVKTGEDVYVDLSKLSISKENYLCIKADNESDEEATLVVVPASVTKLKASYAKDTDTLTFKNGTAAYEKALVYRTANSFTTEDVDDSAVAAGLKESEVFSQYKMTGATLYFSVPAAGDIEPVTGYKFDGTNKIVDSAGGDVTAQVLPARQGKEVKVTIKKLANAPKLTVNYVKGTITLPANSSYRKNVEGADLGGYTTVSAKTVLTLSATEGTNNFTAEKAFSIDIKKKDDSSKVGHTAFKAQGTTPTSEELTGIVTVEEKQVGSGTNTSYKLVIKNSDKTYGYTIGYKKTDGSDASVPVKANKNKTVSKGVAGNQTLTITRDGNASTKEWAAKANTNFYELPELTDPSATAAPTATDVPAAGQITYDIKNGDGEDKSDKVEYKINSADSYSSLSNFSDETLSYGDTIELKLSTINATYKFVVKDANGETGVEEVAAYDSSTGVYKFKILAADVTVSLEKIS